MKDELLNKKILNDGNIDTNQFDEEFKVNKQNTQDRLDKDYLFGSRVLLLLIT